MNKLTEFQNNCEEKLNNYINLHHDISILDRDVKGKKENYLYLKFNVENIEVWIYEQECMFTCSKNDVHFESADYPVKNKLIEDFIQAFDACISGKGMSDMGSGFVKVFDGKDL